MEESGENWPSESDLVKYNFTHHQQFYNTYVVTHKF
jgi:hypothetical protein